MLALLHTSPVHVPVFDALRATRRILVWNCGTTSTPDCWSGRGGTGPEAVAETVAAVLARAVACRARAVLCTCSTIGGARRGGGRRGRSAGAARTGPARPPPRWPSVRVLLVLAALESTLAPTAALIEEEARRADRPVDVRTRLVEGAWSRVEAGDGEGYLRRVAEAADSVTGADVIVPAPGVHGISQGEDEARVPRAGQPGAGSLAAGASAAGCGGSPGQAAGHSGRTVRTAG